LTAVVSYLRSTAPVSQANRPHEMGIILKWFVTKFGPDFRRRFQNPLRFAAASAEPSVQRGEYLARGPAMCFGCHSPFDMMGGTFSGPEFSGSSQAEPDPENSNMVFRTPNLTPDRETGYITAWSEEQFVARFRAGRNIRSSKMPWE